MKTTAAEIVRHAVANTPEGGLLLGRTLMSQARPAAVQKQLERLTRTGAIRRVAQGIFMRPERSPYVLGEIPPDVNELARAVASRSGATIQVHGAEAARRLGLSTQVPMRPVFLTSGSSQKLNVGNMPIELKHAAPRKLILAGRPAGIAWTALWYLGKEEVSAETFTQIEKKLAAEEFQALLAARAQMPAWMLTALQQFEEKQSHGTSRNRAVSGSNQRATQHIVQIITNACTCAPTAGEEEYCPVMRDEEC
jgi:hypothetical protein